MEERFLKKVAKHILELSVEKDIGTEDILVVLPSSRSTVFFNKNFSDLLDKPIWMPQVFSLPQLIAQKGSLEVLGEFDLIRYLYQSYIQHLEADEFVEFFGWGRVMLQDFDELDRSLVDTKKFFRYLYEARAIEDWEIGGEDEAFEYFRKSLQKVEKQKRQNRTLFWEKLGAVYEDLKNNLLKNGFAYEGLAYRQFAEELPEDALKISCKHWIFAGFNALAPSEEKIFNTLHKQQKATFLWDADPYFVKNQHQEAGKFLRSNLAKLPDDLEDTHDPKLSKGKRNVKKQGAPGLASMLSLLNNELKDPQKKSGNFADTVVVLPDPAHAVPVMNHIPPGWGKVNFSMGMTFNHSLLASLFSILEETYQSAEVKNGQPFFYFPTLERFLTHPLVAPLLPEKHNFIASATNKNKIFVAEAELFEYFPQLASGETMRIFPLAMEEAMHFIKKLMTDIGQVQRENNYMESIVVEKMQDSVEMVENALIDQSIPPMEPARLIKLITETARGIRIAFEGDPIEGLQVMGLLETITLDFKNVIILGCNESLLPGNSTNISLFPHDLKRGFDIPGQNEQAAITAYQFYRLIRNAENVTFLYDNDAEGGENEVSRFVRQLEWEWPAANEDVKWEVEDYHQPPVFAESLSVNPGNDRETAEKTNDIVFNQGVSPSQFVTWNLCPLRFYFNYIAGIREPEEVFEDVEAAEFGSIFHEAVANLYEKKKGKVLEVDDFKEMESQSAEILEFAFNNAGVPLDGGGFGKNLLSFDTLLMLIKKMLKNEANNPPFKVVNIEYKLHETIDNQQEKPYKIKGVIDRIDYLPEENKYRIVDYKTGLTESRNLILNADNEPEVTDRNKTAWQLLFYTILAEKLTGGQPVTSSVLSLRLLDEGYQNLQFNGNTNLQSAGQADMKKLLSNKISELKNTEKFLQTEDERLCGYCPYMNFCVK